MSAAKVLPEGTSLKEEGPAFRFTAKRTSSLAEASLDWISMMPL